MSLTNNFELGLELDAKNEEFKYKDTFLGVDILTLTNKVDSVRGSMLSNMLQQAVCLPNAEPPKVFTRYENQVGKYSSSYKKTDKEYKIIAKLRKFHKKDTFYTLLVQDTETKEYDLIERKLGERLTESYCYMIDNHVIDRYREKDIINKDTILYHSKNFDDAMNYGFGINCPACYMIDNDTIEDAIVISESLAEKFKSNYIHEVAVNINTNDLLVNLYGDKEHYKCFPDIGEETKGKVLTARRRIIYENALFDLQDEQLTKINYNSDKIFYCQGTLIDIDVYSNVSIETLEENKYNEQIIKYLKYQEYYYTKLVELLQPIIENPKSKYTNDLSYIYRRAKDILNPDIRWRNDKTDFDNILVVFKILDEINLHIGSKLAGRYGNKGVVSKILPDEEMPISSTGKRAHLILNALGIVNRLNPAQNYEHEINFISDNIVEDMKTMSDKDAIKFYFGYLRDINPIQFKETKEFYKSLSKSNRKRFLDEILEYGIYIHQPPFWDNVNFETLAMLYDKYGYTPYETYIEGIRTEKDLIIADLYMMKLKHEPSGKLSIRSTSYINMKNAPSKSLSYKKHEEIYSHTPIRLGEMGATRLHIINFSLETAA